MPRLESCYFGSSHGHQWPRLAAVLKMTAGQHCRGWTVNVRAVAPGPVRHAESGAAGNTHKLEYWTRLVLEAPLGDELLLIDADTFIAQPLDDIWRWSFDVAYTVRAGWRFPINGGVVFVRATAAAKAFFRAWLEENARLLVNGDERRRWRREFGGMNQAALGCLLRTWPGASTVDKLELPCRLWNCEDSAWSSFDDGTRIVHVKSALRRAIFGLGPCTSELRPLVQRWRALERELQARPKAVPA